MVIVDAVCCDSKSPNFLHAVNRAFCVTLKTKSCYVCQQNPPSASVAAKAQTFLKTVLTSRLQTVKQSSVYSRMSGDLRCVTVLLCGHICSYRRGQVGDDAVVTVQYLFTDFCGL